jgi:hypothetical protein
VAATALVLDGAQQAIAEQAQRWRFEYPTPEDDRQRAAVRAAAEFLVERGPELLPESLPSHPLQLALLALRVYEVFDAPGETRPSEAELARGISKALARDQDRRTPARASSVKRGPRTQP